MRARKAKLKLKAGRLPKCRMLECPVLAKPFRLGLAARRRAQRSTPEGGVSFPYLDNQALVSLPPFSSRQTSRAGDLTSPLPSLAITACAPAAGTVERTTAA